MKSLIAVLILGSALLSPQAPPVGTVRGIVMSAGSNEPLPDVKIFLPIDGKPDAAATREDAVSDAGGNFVITNVPVGRLILRAQLAGYFAPAVDGVTPGALTIPVTVVADRSTDVRITMVRGGSITGRVLDRNGKPMQDITVQPLTSTYVQGLLTAQPFGVDRFTDDRGEYRLYNLAPGEYRVAATPRGLAFRASTGVGASQEMTIRTLYPDAASLANALPVVVHSGDEIGGVDIRMKVANTFRISGSVTSTLPA